MFLGAANLLVKVPPPPAKQTTAQPTPTATPTPDTEKIAAEEKKRQEEETKKFIATYGPCRSVPILMYHHIGTPPDAGQPGGWLFVKTEVFTQQMDYLVGKGYVTVTLPEVMASLQGGAALPAKPVVLTFDDGYRDFFDNAYPILRARSFKATVFVISQLAEGANYLTWEQMREMASPGLITIGDHTLSHRQLASLNNDQVKDEIVSAKNIIESHIGKSVNVFAYPFGSHNGESETILQQNGFLAAVTTARGLSCSKLPFELPRIRIGSGAMSSYGL